MKVINEVKIYEIDGVGDRDGPEVLFVESHWNWRDRVILRVGNNSEALTVLADELLKAITNATNHT